MNEEQQHETEVESGDAPAGVRPTMKFTGSGGIVVAVWKSKSNAGFDNYNVRIERNYRKEDGTFDVAKSLRDWDLLRAQQLLGQADAWIEQDKAKGRASQSAGRA